jgi:predicted ATPase
MRDLLNNLQKEGATAIIASHKPVAAATTRWLLKNGDIAGD